VILLDAYALIAFLTGGPATQQVRAILREGGAVVVTANLVEVLDVSQRVHRLPIQRTAEILESLLEGPLTAVPLDVAVARRAGEIRGAYYHRASRPISLADAVLIGSAGEGDRIATADPDVLAVAHAERLETIALPLLECAASSARVCCRGRELVETASLSRSDSVVLSRRRKTMSVLRDGGCACGAVRYRLTSDPMFTHCCHCLNCQRQTGSAFVINALIEADRVELLEGKPEAVDVPRDDGSKQRISRCPNCQVAVFSDYGRPEILFVRAGTLDQPSAVTPDVHIFTRSKLPWITLPDSVPAFDVYYDSKTLWPAASLERLQAVMAPAGRDA
jgi:predicted nucleic acid-binding protein